LLNSLIAQKVSGLAISADDADALVPTGQAAIAAGIPVVTWDSNISKGGTELLSTRPIPQGIGDNQVQMGSRPDWSFWRRDRHPERHGPGSQPECLDRGDED